MARAEFPRLLATIEWFVLPVFVCEDTPPVCVPAHAADSDASNERIDYDVSTTSCPAATLRRTSSAVSRSIMCIAPPQRGHTQEAGRSVGGSGSGDGGLSARTCWQRGSS